MPPPSWWKEFYAAERSSLGSKALEQLIVDAPQIKLPERAAIIFPHTRLASSGHLTAGAVRAIIESGCETVVALGVLHGIDRKRADLRGIHSNDEITRDEFSLDNFEALLSIAASISGKRMPKLIAQYPFLAGDDPDSLSGFEEVSDLVQGGTALVATADMVHHGIGYGTPIDSFFARESEQARDFTRQAIHGQLGSLALRDYSPFLLQCDAAHSDFRDVGPLLASLQIAETPNGVGSNGISPYTILDMTLVNYADVLNSEEPTWVAAALATFGAS